MMKRTILLWGAAFVMALMAVACGGTQQESSVQDSLVNQSDDVTI
jgi:ABC-type glycerol-3-phosphate transport system substrate-binding protein